MKEEVYKGCRVFCKYTFNEDTKAILMVRCNGLSDVPYKVFVACHGDDYNIQSFNTQAQAEKDFMSRCLYLQQEQEHDSVTN